MIGVIWAMVPGPIRRALAWLLAAGVAAAAVFFAGKREARKESALDAAERIAKAEIKRGRIDDEIQQDVDLVARARAAGVVRDGSE